MAWFSALHELLTDDRLTANIIAGHGMVTVTFLAAVVVRRRFQAWATAILGEHASDGLLNSWRQLAEGYLVLTIRLGALWSLGHCAGLGKVSDLTIGFAFRILTILTFARLITQGVRVAA